ESQRGPRAEDVSLQALEAFIATLPGVEDVALTFAPSGEDPPLLAAVVGQGLGAPQLLEAVAAQFAPGWAPDRVLFIDCLKRDASGKLPHARLLRHFGLRADGAEVNYRLHFA